MIATASKPLIYTFQAKDGTPVCLRPVQLTDAVEIIDSALSIINQGEYIQKERVRNISEEELFIKEMLQNGNMYVAVEVNGVVRGIARVIRGELQMKRHIGMFRTWLHEEAQGKGIGKQVMNYTLKWCEMNNLHKLCLTVFATNKIASKLYENAGFIVEGIQKEQAILNSRYVDEIWMAYFFNQKGGLNE